MTNYPYTTGIPKGSNDPSDDRPNMTQNTDSISSLISEDHYGFNVANGGFHQQIRMPNLLSIPPAGNRISNSTTLYSKLNGNSQLYITNGTSSNEYQLTRMDNNNSTTFAVFSSVTYSPSNLLGNAGWTFLPGGLRLQYGTVDPGNLSTSKVDFPILYTTIYMVTINYISSSLRSWQLSSYDNTGFTFLRDSTSSSRLFTWQAIGI